MHASLVAELTKNLRSMADAVYMAIKIENDVNKAVTKMNVVLEALMKQGEIILPWLSMMYDCRLTSKNI